MKAKEVKNKLRLRVPSPKVEETKKDKLMSRRELKQKLKKEVEELK